MCMFILMCVCLSLFDIIIIVIVVIIIVIIIIIIVIIYKGVSKSFRTESITKEKPMNTFRSNTKGYGGKITRLTHKIAIQLYLVAESCTICSSYFWRPVRKLLDTLSYIHARPVSPGIVQQIMPTVYTSGSLDTWMIVCLTATKFDTFIFPMLGFVFVYIRKHLHYHEFV
jgi:hypothetical protein